MQICKFAGNLSTKRAVPFFEERPFKFYYGVCYLLPKRIS